MKILAIINISNINDLMCDSGVIFQRVLAHELSRLGIDYRILGPDIEAFRSHEFDGATKCYAHLGTTRYSARFSFDWSGVQAAIEQHDPEIIFNNQVELTAALRSLLVTLGRGHVKIVTYCHYPALWGPSGQSLNMDESLNHENLGTAIVLDIISALLTSDYFVTQSEFARSLIVSAAHHHNFRSFQDIVVIPPPADPLLLDPAPRVPPRNRQVLYNHRLYQTYGTAEFLDFIGTKAPSDIELVVSDPMPSRSTLRQSLSASPAHFREQVTRLPGASIFNGNIERHEYRNIISRARVSFAAFRKACVWSMASVDCMGLGVPVLAPGYAAYPEFIPSELLFSNHEEAADLTHRLLVDDEFWQRCSLRCQRVAQSLAPRRIAGQFFELFTALGQASGMTRVSTVA